jgi:WD40 repeat protein
LTIERYQHLKNGLSRIATSFSDGSVRILSPISGKTILTLFPPHKYLYVKQISYNMEWCRLFYLCTNGDIIVYDTSTSPGRIIEIWETSQILHINSLFSWSYNMESVDNYHRSKHNILRLIVGTIDGQIVTLNSGKPEAFVQVS